MAELKSGGKTLRDGAYTFYNSSKTLTAGTSELYRGTGELLNGILSLESGVSELSSGAEKLEGGSKDLKDGMKEFKEKGIDKIISAYEDNFKELKDKLIKLSDISKDYNSFAGIGDNMAGKVKFIYTIDAIEKPDEE